MQSSSTSATLNYLYLVKCLISLQRRVHLGNLMSYAVANFNHENENLWGKCFDHSSTIGNVWLWSQSKGFMWIRTCANVLHLLDDIKSYGFYFNARCRMQAINEFPYSYIRIIMIYDGKGICLESNIHHYECSSDFIFPLQDGVQCTLQLLIQCYQVYQVPIIAGWTVECTVCVTLLNKTSTSNQTLYFLILIQFPINWAGRYKHLILLQEKRYSKRSDVIRKGIMRNQTFLFLAQRYHNHLRVTWCVVAINIALKGTLHPHANTQA